MKRYIKSSTVDFPPIIEIEVYPDEWCIYKRSYEHEGGGCYYHSDECTDPVIKNFVSLYPDGRLTFLWNGVESNLDRNWRE